MCGLGARHRSFILKKYFNDKIVKVLVKLKVLYKLKIHKLMVTSL
uniref:Uncharacterized protein LOC104215421 n=1 Tax=Nicotiana sylvestris TaxID=4096 RepID=A0A1U7VMC6_NICSY|nr:PREDICTED: uncharacterized protein LOC104215421 [Nicotiana sylvestris]